MGKNSTLFLFNKFERGVLVLQEEKGPGDALYIPTMLTSCKLHPESG